MKCVSINGLTVEVHVLTDTCIRLDDLEVIEEKAAQAAARAANDVVKGLNSARRPDPATPG